MSKCSEPIYDGFARTRACDLPVKCTEDGKPWCTMHAPSKVAERTAKKRARWDFEAKCRQARRAIDDIESCMVHVCTADDLDVAKLGALRENHRNAMKALADLIAKGTT